MDSISTSYNLTDKANAGPTCSSDDCGHQAVLLASCLGVKDRLATLLAHIFGWYLSEPG
jgi:hypothetical protein